MNREEKPIKKEQERSYLLYVPLFLSMHVYIHNTSYKLKGLTQMFDLPKMLNIARLAVAG